MTTASIVTRSLGPRIVEWRIDRPQRRNAVAPTDLDWITQQAATCDGEVVVLTGTGDAAFCAGFDLKALAESTEPTPDLSLLRATAAMADARAVFVASIVGPAVGAGVELAAACDFRVAHTEASFRIPAGRLGVVYHADGLARLHAVFGGALTRRMLLAGEKVSAEQARRLMGAIDEIAESPEATRAAAQNLAERVAAQAPLSVAGNRRYLRALDRASVSEAVDRAHDRARAEAYASRDHAEARAAVAGKRDPQFEGR